MRVIFLGFLFSTLGAAGQFVSLPDSAFLQSVNNRCRVTFLEDVVLGSGPSGSKTYRANKRQGLCGDNPCSTIDIVDILNAHDNMVVLKKDIPMRVTKVFADQFIACGSWFCPGKHPNAEEPTKKNTSNLAVVRTWSGSNVSKIHLEGPANHEIVINLFEQLDNSVLTIPSRISPVRSRYGSFKSAVNFSVECWAD